MSKNFRTRVQFSSLPPPRRGKPFGSPHFCAKNTASLYRLPLLLPAKSIEFCGNPVEPCGFWFIANLLRERLRRKCFYGAASLYRLAHRFDLSDMFLKEIFIMLSYNFSKSDGLPNWEETEKIQIDKLLWTTDTDIKAYAQLFCGTDRLFVHLHADEKPIRTEGEGLLDEPCLDSCLEFFLSPVDKDMRYINIEMNPNFCLYFSIGTGNSDLVKILLPGGAQALNANCRRKSDFWDLYYELSFSLIRLFFNCLPNF